MIYLLFIDLLHIYKVFYVLVTEILERFGLMPVDQAKKSFVVYQNFVSLTGVMKNKAEKILQEFEFNVKLPQSYTPDASWVENLRTCIDVKAKGGSSSQQGIEKISS